MGGAVTDAALRSTLSIADTSDFPAVICCQWASGASVAIRYALAIVEKASVVPGIDGSTDESTTKTLDQPNGLPSRSLSSSVFGVDRIENDPPQCVPDPGLENLIIQKQNSVTTTSAFTGIFLNDQRSREEFVKLISADLH